jgi:hypothetical protein
VLRHGPRATHERFGTTLDAGELHRGVPLGGSGPVIDTLRLSAEEAAGLLERGDVAAAELADAYRAAIGARDDELHC